MKAVAVLLFLQSAQPAQPAFIPAGTPVKARLESPVKTGSSSVGDAVAAVVTEPVRAAGKIVIPEGSRLNGRVETISPATESSEGRVRLVFRDVQFPDGRGASIWITESFSAPPPKRNLRYALSIGIGAAAGGLIGGKAARTSGIIGGTLVGFVIVWNTGSGKFPDLVLKRGRVIQLRLGEDFNDL